MNPKLVTVIIPTYNRSGLIANAIKSALGQTYPSVQIIVVDDGSIDDTAQKVAEFNGVEYYHQENSGQGSSRNLGLQYAKGDYIASLDSDDVWNENFLETAVEALETLDVDLVFLNWMEINGNQTAESDWERSNGWRPYKTDTTGEWRILDGAEFRDLVLTACPAPSSALVIRRNSMPARWNEEMQIGDDWYLLIEIALTKPSRLAFTLKTHWTKRIHNTNVYHGRDELEIIRHLGFHDENIMLRDFDRQLSVRERTKFKRRLAIHRLNFGRLTWRRDGISPASFSYIMKAIGIVPIGSLLYIIKMSFNSLSHHLRMVRKHSRESPETR